MRLLQFAMLSNIIVLATVLTAMPPSHGPQESKSTAMKNASEQLPFVDARNVTVMVFFADPPPQQGMLPIAHASASGSGVWVGKKGYIATCQHVTAPWTGPFKIGFARDAYVAEGGLTITVGASVNVWDADLVASDPDSDVAILKAHVSPSNAEPPPLVTGNSVAGEQVITPQIQIKPKGTDLRTDFPAPGRNFASCWLSNRAKNPDTASWAGHWSRLSWKLWESYRERPQDIPLARIQSREQWRPNLRPIRPTRWPA